MSAPLRIVFLGSDSIALPGLEWLERQSSSDARIVGVFTQPDRASGRGQQSTPNAIKRWAEARSLPVFQPDKLSEDVRLQLADLRPDLSLVMAYGHILRDDFIATPRLGTLNLHASILPNYRGASPIQTAIASGERETGITLMRIVRALDAGPTARVAAVPIAELDTALDVEAKLAAVCGPLLAETLPLLAAGKLSFVEQNHVDSTYCRRLAKEDGGLDFAVPAAELAARIRGLYPWPSASVEMAGVIVKVGLADALPDSTDVAAVNSDKRTPGLVLGLDALGLRVATRSGSVRFLKLQRPGGKMLAAADFFRGFPLEANVVLPSRPMHALVSRQPFPYRPTPPPAA